MKLQKEWINFLREQYPHGSRIRLREMKDPYSGCAEINGGNMELIYVASPYAGDIERNTEFAKDACRFVMNEGHAFFAPHLLYPQVLDEHDSDDRRLGLDMGKEVLAHCDELWVFGDTVSRGMKSEIDAAWKLGIPIKYVAAQKMAERERPFAEKHHFCSMRL